MSPQLGGSALGQGQEIEKTAQLEEMNRRLRWLLDLAQRITIGLSAEDCLEQFCAAMAAELESEPPRFWRGEQTLEPADAGVRQAANEAREQGGVVAAVTRGASGESASLLLVPIPVPRAAADLIVFRRAEAFTASEQTITSLAVSFLEAALRSQGAMQELRESQAQLHQSERMKSIGQLAGGVAHDFNNMLMVISAAAEVMSDTLSGPGSTLGGAEHPCMSHLRLIINTSHRAAELTRKLLTFSRKARLTMSVVDVHDVLGSVREFLVHAIDRRITVQLSLAGGACLVQADTTQLQNALLNICLNARDAMPEGGLLKISTERVELDAASSGIRYPELKPGPYVQLEVRDNGTGMDAATLERAFDPFFTTKEPGRGTGLGLSVVFGSIREHGGSVVLESAVGQGTCCTILLPLLDRASVASSALSPAKERSLSLRILLLDDEPGVCRTAAQLLRQLGHNVQALRDGEKALNHLRSHASGYDLLVLDVMMPHPTGIEVHRALLGDGIDLPTVFVSGYSEQHLLDGVAAGAGIVFLQKPFRQTDLADAILRCIESSRADALRRAALRAPS